MKSYIGIILLCTLMVYHVSFSQDNHVERQDFIATFFEENPAVDHIKLKTQCEFSLLYAQYEQNKEPIGSSLSSVFKKILNTYSETGRLDTSYRLETEKLEMHRHDDKVKEYNFVYKSPGQSSSNNKPLGGDGDSEKTNTCINADFESGNFNNWQLAWSSSDGLANLAPGTDNPGMNSLIGNHVLMGPGAGTDAMTGGNLPRIYPEGGTYSLRLGDEEAGWNAAKATYTFVVTPETELFIYHYAVVLEDPGHLPELQPYLEIKLTIDGVEEPCGYYYQAAAGNAPGFEFYQTGGQFSSTIRYKNWSTNSIVMTPYMGQTATVEFITSDCAEKGHFGYAYIDAECNEMPSLTEATLTCDESSVMLSGPPGATGYIWTGPGIVGANNQMEVEVDTPGTYQVSVVPSSGVGCAYVIDVEVIDETGGVVADFNVIPEPACVGASILFENTSTDAAGSGAFASTSWDFGDGETATDHSPNHSYSAPGTYTVTLTVVDVNGCSGTVSHEVSITSGPDLDYSFTEVCEGTVTTFQDLSSVDPTTNDAISDCLWGFGDGNSSTSENPTHQYSNEGTYDVTLTVSTVNGCSNTITFPVDVHPNPEPAFTASQSCVGEETSFTDQSTVGNGGTIESWSWDFTSGGTSTVQNPTHIYGTAGTYNPTLTVVSDQGCSATTTEEVTVYSTPEIEFTATEACLNTLVTFTSETVINGGASGEEVSGWAWDFGDGNSATIQNPTHTYTNSGVYNVSLEATTNYGCSHVLTQEVTIAPGPTVDFTVLGVCEGELFSFENESIADPNFNDPIDSWSWDFGDGNTSTNENETHQYAGEGTYDVILTVASVNGCVNSLTLPVEVYSNPTPSFITTESCLNGATEFTDESEVNSTTTTSEIVNWDWDFTDGKTSTDQNPSNTYGEEGTFYPILTVTTDKGCSESYIGEVTVYPLPNIHIVTSEACLNTSMTFTDPFTSNEGETGNLITNWAWDFGDGTTSNQEDPSHTYANSGTFTVSLEVTTENGCVNTVSEEVTVIPLPVAGFGHIPNCLGGAFTFTDESTTDAIYDDLIESWSWDFGDGNTSTEQNPTHVYSDQGVYAVVLTIETEEGCVNEITLPAEVLPSPVASFTYTNVCFGEETAFTNESVAGSSSAANNIVSWEWDFDDGTTSIEENPLHTYLNDGVYNPTLTVTSEGGCVSMATEEVVVYAIPVAGFTAEMVCSMTATHFSDQSVVNNADSTNTITNWAWDFGDGNTSTDQNPENTYIEGGDFDVNLTVTSSQGCVGEFMDEVSVYRNPVADFIADSVCLGTVNSFQDISTADETNNDLIDDWLWDFGGNGTETVKNPTYTFGAENSYDITLTVTTDKGCSDEITQTILVYPVPEVELLSSEDCLGSPTVFTDQSTVSNENSTNQLNDWSWDFGNGNTSSLQNPGHTFEEEGVYEVTLTVTTDKGCSSTTTSEVAVFPNPVVDFEPADLCLGLTTSFNDLSSVSNTNSSNSIEDWAWDFGDGNSGATQNPTNTYSAAGSYDVTLSVTTSRGCSSSETLEVYIFPQPVADFSLDSLCLGESSSFEDLSTVDNTNGDAINNWSWNFGNGQTSNDQSPDYTYPSENSYNVTLTVTTNNGCTDTKERVTEIYPTPVASFNASGVCQDAMTEFSDESTVNNTNTINQITDWSWGFGDGEVSVDANPTHTYSTSGTFQVTLSVVSNHDCTSSITSSVQVYPVPEIDFTGVDLEGCSPSCPEVIATTGVTPSNNTEYVWTLSDGTVYEGNSSVFSDCFENSSGGNISYGLHLAVTTEHGCSATHNEDNYITVFPNPTANFILSPDVLDVIDPTVYISNTSHDADSYFWDIEGYGTSNAVNPNNVTFPSEAGMYHVNLIAYSEHGCTDTLEKTIEVIDEVIFYIPNSFTPDQDQYNEVFNPVFANGVDSQDYVLYIFNRWGELVFESHDPEVGWDGTYGSDSYTMAKDGTYVWKLQFKEARSSNHHSYVGHVNLLR